MLKKIETQEEAIEWYKNSSKPRIYCMQTTGSILWFNNPEFKAAIDRWYYAVSNGDLRPITELSLEVTPKKRPMTNPEIFCALKDGAVLLDPTGDAINFWYSSKNVSSHKICYNYTDTDSDIWEELEVTE